MTEPEIHIGTQDARQGKGGLRLSLILAVVLLCAVVAGVLLYAFVF